jgi:alcohol dehydrogenase
MGFTAPFGFALPTRIEFGIGILAKLPAVLRENPGKRIMIVTDRIIGSLGWFRSVLDLLDREGFTVMVFDGVEGNPKDRNVEDAAEVARSFKANALLAVGGGSSIDCAKGVSVCAVRGGRIRDYEDRSRIGKGLLPIVAVPTTAGTGSEITFGAVITDTCVRFKFTVKSPEMAPRAALLDPELTVSMPPSLTAATGMDALTHAIEAFTSRAAEPISDACALYAAELVAANLPRACRRGDDLEARSAVLLGSLIAGIAFSHSDVGAVHCIAEALGGMYDIPHGVGNAVCLPAVMERCKEACSSRYARLAQAMGIPRGTADDAVSVVAGLAEEVGLPPFSNFRVPPGDFPLIAERSAANGSNADNVPVLSESDYMGILERLSR